MNLGIALGLGPRTLGGFTPPPFSAIAADGWQTTVASPSDLTLRLLTL